MEDEIQNYSQIVMFRGTPYTPCTLNVCKSLKSQPRFVVFHQQILQSTEQRIKCKIIAQVIQITRQRQSK